jgi:hypothetical protein
MYLRITNHWAVPITAPARAPASAPDAAPSIEPTTRSANTPLSGKPRNVSIHHRKNRHPAARGWSLAITIASRQGFDPGSRTVYRVALRCLVPSDLGSHRNIPVKASQIDHRMYPTTTMFAAGSNPAGSSMSTTMPTADTTPKRPSYLLNGSDDPNIARATKKVQRLVKR